MAKRVIAQVYSPAEDSWLLEECILKADLQGKKCLDLGTGSGILAEALLRAGAENIFAVDVNPAALAAAKIRIGALKRTQNIGHFGKVKFVQSDLFSSLVREKFDFIVFNPPYLPSDEIKWIDLDGGKKGREVIEKFLAQFPNHLNKKAVVLLLLSSLNEPKEILARLKRQGFSVGVAARKKLFFEELLVLRCIKE